MYIFSSVLNKNIILYELYRLWKKYHSKKNFKDNLKLKNIYDGTYEVGEVSLELNVIVELSMWLKNDI